MADPLSIAASVIAIAELAARSCECLYKYIKHFSEADGELNEHLDAVKSLRIVFSGIADLQQDHPDLASHLTADFSNRLEICLTELQETERYVQSYKMRLDQGRVRRAWAKARWSSVDHRQRLKKRLDRISFHYRTFSLDLILLNM